MVRRKGFDFKKWIWIGAVPTSLGAIGFIAVNLTTYIKLPDRVASAEEKVDTIEDYIQKQQMANELMQQMIQQKDEVIYSPDKKYYWDSEKEKWLPGKGGK